MPKARHARQKWAWALAFSSAILRANRRFQAAVHRGDIAPVRIAARLGPRGGHGALPNENEDFARRRR
jgi:hypothetical protein